MPDDETAAILGAIIDRARASIGWGRLPEGEHDIAIVAWFEILSDAGVPVERYDDCYRSAQRKRNELRTRGEQISILTANDMVVEWEQIRQMHAEIDGVRLLPETASSVCPRCDGTDWERMSDGSRRHGCKHEYTSEEEAAHILIRDRTLVEEKAAEMREALKTMASVKAMPALESKQDLTVKFTCAGCGRKVSSEFGWNYNDVCGVRLIGPVREDERFACQGRMKVL